MSFWRKLLEWLRNDFGWMGTDTSDDDATFNEGLIWQGPIGGKGPVSRAPGFLLKLEDGTYFKSRGKTPDQPNRTLKPEEAGRFPSRLAATLEATRSPIYSRAMIVPAIPDPLEMRRTA